MTAPHRSGAEQATIRGAIVLFVAVVIGLGLLSKSNGLVGRAEAGASKSTSTTTSTGPTGSTTAPPSTEAPINNGGGSTGTTAAARPKGQVKVLVINAGEGLIGVGKTNGDLLATAGFVVAGINDAPTIATSVVYYADGYQADADAVKKAVKLTTAKTAKAPATPIVPAMSQANVTVVIGKDYKR